MASSKCKIKNGMGGSRCGKMLRRLYIQMLLIAHWCGLTNCSDKEIEPLRKDGINFPMSNMAGWLLTGE